MLLEEMKNMSMSVNDIRNATIGMDNSPFQLKKEIFQNLIIKLVTFELVSLERHSQFASILYYYEDNLNSYH